MPHGPGGGAPTGGTGEVSSRGIAGRRGDLETGEYHNLGIGAAILELVPYLTEGYAPYYYCTVVVYEDLLLLMNTTTDCCTTVHKTHISNL